MSISYHSFFWYPGKTLKQALPETLEVLFDLGFRLEEAPARKRAATPADCVSTYPANPEKPALSAGPLLHLPTDSWAFASIEEFRSNGGVAVQVHLSAKEFEFRRQVYGVTDRSAAKSAYEAVLFTFYERSGAFFGHAGAGELTVSDFIPGVSYEEGRLIAASKVIRGEIPLLDLLNFIPKVMYSRFGRSIEELPDYDQRVRVLALRDEALFLAFSGFMTEGGGADWRRFAADFGLKLDIR